MRPPRHRLLLAVLPLLPCAVSSQETIAIAGVDVIPVDAPGVLRDHTVVVRGERIERLGPASEVDTAECEVVLDGHGLYLIPGLADMHVHLPRSEEDDFSLEEVFDLQLAAGVTTVRSMRGAPEDVALRDDIAAGRRAGPRVLAGSPGFDGGWAKTPELARQLVRSFAETGYDFVKILEGFDGPTFEALAAEAREVGLPLAGHLSEHVPLERALEMLHTIEHLHGHGAAYLRDLEGFAELARRTAESGAWVCPTLGFQVSWYAQEDVEEMERWPGMELARAATLRRDVERAFERADVGPETRDEYARIMTASYAAVRALADAGVGLLVSPSGGWFLVPGFKMHVELRHLARAGLAPAEILEAATLNAARAAGAEDEWGSIGAGKAADLVLLAANPLDDVRHAERVVAVVRKGELYDREELDRRLKRVRARRE